MTAVRHSFALWLLGACAAAVAAAGAPAIDHREAREFFDRYVALAQSHDPRLAELYADDARIRATQRLPNGNQRVIELTGTQYRKLIRQTFSGEVSHRDRSEYTDVVVESTRERTRIRARRHAVRKCYWDNGFYLTIERQRDGRLRIVEENLDTHPQSTC